MRRAAFERPRVLRVWRRHRLLIHDLRPDLCACKNQPGRFRKREKVAGCGNARCYYCRAPKLLKLPTRQVRRADLSYREWLLQFGFQIGRLRRRCS